jgi:pyruvate,water dikinase
VVLHPADGDFHDGEVLVTVNANPSLMPLLQRCSAIVTDEGGASCHAAILARELRKPCVIGTGQATSRIRSGQHVRVDAFAQTVTLLPADGAKTA